MNELIHFKEVSNSKHSTEALLAAGNTFLAMAEFNVATLELKATREASFVYYTLISLCCLEFLAVAVFVYLTPRTEWVDEQSKRTEQLHGEYKAVSSRAEQLDLERREAPAKAYMEITKILCHNLKGFSSNATINVDMLRQLLNESSIVFEDELVKESINALLSLVSCDSTQVQHSVRSVQMISDIANNANLTPAHEDFDLRKLIEHLSTIYPTLHVTNWKSMSIVRGDEAATFHLLHSAVRNAVVHGATHEVVHLEVQTCEAGIVFTLFNSPGPNHQEMCTLQEGGLQLMDETAEAVDLQSLNLGLPGSSYQGCREMRRLTRFLGGKAKLIFVSGESASLEQCSTSSDHTTQPAVKFQLELPDLVPVLQPSRPVSDSSVDLSEVCVLCADDQNPPRLQVASAIHKLGLNNMQQPRKLSDVQNGIFRDEPKLKLFGRTADEVAPEVWTKVLKDWKGKPAVIILDQHICFPDITVLGVDICKRLKKEGFNGVVAIRSGNDNQTDRHAYKVAGADATISKSLTAVQLATELKKLMIAATVRFSSPQLRSWSPDLAPVDTEQPLLDEQEFEL